MEKERVDAEALLRHKDFVRGLALKLVFDEHRADDVVQETWLAALENAPERPRSLRAWLARVARNLALRAARTELRRTQRETRAARPDRTPPGVDAVERLARERRVVDAVLQLEEPYRTVVVLRYYEDLKPAAIARRLDCNPATVRTRLKRGLELLRGRLDGEFGSRRAWRLSLVPLLVPPASMAGAATATGGGVVVMSAKSKSILAAGVLLAALLGLWWTLERSRATPPEHAPGVSRLVSPAAADATDEPVGATDDGAAAARIRVTVRVVVPGGAPVPRASVDAIETDHLVPGNWIGGDDAMYRIGGERVPVASARTDADGRALFEHAAERTLVYAARKAGLARRISAPVVLATAETEPPGITIVLEDGHALAGTVRDGAGRPVAGALVLAHAPAFTEHLPWNAVPARAITGIDGVYRFDGLEAADTGLWAALPGGVPYPVATVRVPDVPRFDITLPRGGVVTGVVTDAATGRPVASATVRVMGYFQHRACVLTGPDGRYVVNTLPPTMLSSIKVDAEGYTHMTGQDYLRTRLGPGETFRHDIALRKGTRVHGTVRGGGRPLAGAWITAFNQSQTAHRNFFGARTDERGRYELVLPAVRHRLNVGGGAFFLPGQHVTTRLAEATGYEPNVLDVPEQAELKHDIDLEPVPRGSAVLAGRALDPKGNPVAGVHVYTAPRDGVLAVVAGGVKHDRTAGARTGADGAFRIEGVFAGTAQIWATAETHRLAGPVTVQLHEGEERSGLPLAMVPAHRLTGTVRGPDGPAKNAVVFVARKPDVQGQPMQRASAWANAWANAERIAAGTDGRFETAVLGTTRVVRAVAPGHAGSRPLVLVFGDGDRRVDIALERGRTIEGRVFDKKARPVPGARVRVMVDDGLVPHARFQGDGPARTIVAVTGADGGFAIRHVPAGGGRVQASAPGHNDQVLDATGGRLHFELEPALVIRGTLTYPDGTAAAGLRVYVLDGTDKRTYSAGTSPTGAFEIEKLGPGRYRIVAGGPGARTITTRPFEAGGAPLRLRVERAGPGEDEDWPTPLEGDGSISGRVLDLKGRGIGDVRVYATHVDLGTSRLGRSTRTAPDGRFTVRGLRDGEHRITAAVPPRNFLRPGPTAVATGRTDVVLRFGAIAGRIRDEAGRPLANRRVEAAGPDDFDPYVETDAEGRFKITGLDPGTYRLALRPQKGVPHRLLRDADAVAAGTQGLELVAAAGARLSGRIEDEAGRPLADVPVVAEGPAGRAFAYSGENGRFEITGLVDGAVYEVKSFAKGRITFVKSEVRAPAAVRVVLPGGPRTAGRLLDRDGHPLAGTQIRFTPSDGESKAYAKTDAEGRFETRSLRPDTEYVAAYWPTGLVRGPGDPKPEWVPCGTARAGADGLELRQR